MLLPAQMNVRTIQGTLCDETGKPVPNQAVEIIGMYGRSFSTMTDAQGEFSLTLDGGFQGQCVPVVHEGGKVVPVAMVREGQSRVA